ncbi:MAG: response regulator transcription factor [Actinomycetes bacterium]
MIRILIVDDHAIVRQGLEQLLTSAAFEIVGTASNGEQAVEMARDLELDVILMDLSMPGIGGIEATRRIIAAAPKQKIVVLTSFADQQIIIDALDAGATGYILKDTPPDEIIAALTAASAGGSPLDPKAARVLLDHRRAGRETRALSDREQEVLALVAKGLPNKAIARSLGITERTVKAHLTNVFQVLGVTDRTQAALWAREHQSLDDS